MYCCGCGCVYAYYAYCRRTSVGVWAFKSERSASPAAYEGGVDSTCTRRVACARSAGHAPQAYLLSRKVWIPTRTPMMGVTIPLISCVTGCAERANFVTQKPYHSSSMHTPWWAGMHTLVPHHPIIPQGESADRLGMVRSRVADLENLPSSLTFFRFGYGALCVTRLILPNLQFVQYVRTYHTQRPAVSHTHAHK